MPVSTAPVPQRLTLTINITVQQVWSSKSLCPNTLGMAVFSLATVCPCQQFVLEDGHMIGPQLNSYYIILRKFGIESTTDGLQGEQFNHTTTMSTTCLPHGSLDTPTASVVPCRDQAVVASPSLHDRYTSYTLP